MECADIGAPQRDGRVCSSLAVAMAIATLFCMGASDSVTTANPLLATQFVPLQDARC